MMHVSGTLHDEETVWKGTQRKLSYYDFHDKLTYTWNTYRWVKR